MYNILLQSVLCNSIKIHTWIFMDQCSADLCPLKKLDIIQLSPHTISYTNVKPLSPFWLLYPLLKWVGGRSVHTCICHMEGRERQSGYRWQSREEIVGLHQGATSSQQLPSLGVIGTSVGVEGLKWLNRTCFPLLKCLIEQPWERQTEEVRRLHISVTSVGAEVNRTFGFGMLESHTDCVLIKSSLLSFVTVRALFRPFVSNICLWD